MKHLLVLFSNANFYAGNFIFLATELGQTFTSFALKTKRKASDFECMHVSILVSCKHHAAVSHYTTIIIPKLLSLDNLLPYIIISGASEIPTSQVCSSPMLVLPTVGK
jgi:hypothetical protein